MKKIIDILCWLALTLAFGYLIAIFVSNEIKENLKLKVALKAYQVANGENVARDTMRLNKDLIDRASADEGIESDWLRATLHYENGAMFHEAGCKKIFEDIACKYPADEWQVRTCARIIGNAWRSYLNTPEVERGFAKYFYSRYCSHAKAAPHDVYLLKIHYDKLGG